ncbi:MAG: hypothetical protein NT037_03640 [Hyphomicrobiales bacterium]|nr:hypothetical protein [Hyphomicrobiales bacterium]
MFYGRPAQRLVGYDNERGKGDHCHGVADEVPCQFTSLGLDLEGGMLALFKANWRHVINVRTIRHVRVPASMDGKPSTWLDIDHAPPDRLPGYGLGSAQPVTVVFRQRGLSVKQGSNGTRAGFRTKAPPRTTSAARRFQPKS